MGEQRDKLTPRKMVPVGQWMMLPAPAGTCAVCAVKHDPEHPHNAQSLHYQYRFYGETGRWPNWKDAMEHCTPEMKQFWKEELQKRGVDIEKGQINARRAAAHVVEGFLDVTGQSARGLAQSKTRLNYEG